MSSSTPTSCRDARRFSRDSAVDKLNWRRAELRSSAFVLELDIAELGLDSAARHGVVAAGEWHGGGVSVLWILDSLGVRVGVLPPFLTILMLVEEVGRGGLEWDRLLKHVMCRYHNIIPNYTHVTEIPDWCHRSSWRRWRRRRWRYRVHQHRMILPPRLLCLWPTAPAPAPWRPPAITRPPGPRPIDLGGGSSRGGGSVSLLVLVQHGLARHVTDVWRRSEGK